MLTSLTGLLQVAQSGNCAIGGFNVYNLEGVRAAIRAAETYGSPLILQLHPAAIKHGGLPLISLCTAAAAAADVPAMVHLDHATDEKDIRTAVQAGIPSIMVDGSHLPYEDNLAFTKRLTDWAHKQGVTVEAELGRISGTEDGLTVADRDARMTNPVQAIDFVRETNIDALAVCIGNVHGRYPGEPSLDFDRLAVIRDAVDVPLVLHGASGLPDNMIHEAIQRGVRKFNVNTEVRAAYIATLRDCAFHPNLDLLDIMKQAEAAMQTVIEEKLRLFKSAGRLNT